MAGEDVPFGSDLIFVAENYPDFAVHVEICEDLWTPLPPSSYAALAGAMVLANLSASNITIGKAEYRRLLCASQSAKCVSAYVYTAAGFGESTTDLAWDGQGLIYENGELLAETERFANRSQVRHRRSRFGASAPGPRADDELQRLRRASPRSHRRHAPYPFQLRDPGRRGAAQAAASTAFPLSRPMPQAGTSAAARSTTSKCTG